MPTVITSVAGVPVAIPASSLSAVNPLSVATTAAGASVSQQFGALFGAGEWLSVLFIGLYDAYYQNLRAIYLLQ